MVEYMTKNQNNSKAVYEKILIHKHEYNDFDAFAIPKLNCAASHFKKSSQSNAAGMPHTFHPRINC